MINNAYDVDDNQENKVLFYQINSNFRDLYKLWWITFVRNYFLERNMIVYFKQKIIIKKCINKNHVYAHVPPSLSLILTTMICYLNHGKCGCFLKSSYPFSVVFNRTLIMYPCIIKMNHISFCIGLKMQTIILKTALQN